MPKHKGQNSWVAYMLVNKKVQYIKSKYGTRKQAYQQHKPVVMPIPYFFIFQLF